MKAVNSKKNKRRKASGVKLLFGLSYKDICGTNAKFHQRIMNQIFITF